MKRLPVLLCAAIAMAQEQPFRSETRVVQVPVTVTDATGHNVDGLKARDFTVLDEGVPQPFEVDTFGRGMAPISLVVAIQASGVSAATMARVRRIGSMIQPLVIGHRGEAAVVTFDNHVEWRLDFTSDPELIQTSLRNLRTAPQKQARLFDALTEAAIRMKERKGRRIVLLICDTHDKGSQARQADAAEAVEREGVQVFETPYPATGADLEKAVEKLGAEVHSQYILSFPPMTGKQGRHLIEVSTPNRADLHIRSRQAYWAE